MVVKDDEEVFKECLNFRLRGKADEKLGRAHESIR